MTGKRYQFFTAEEKRVYCDRAIKRYRRLRDAGLCARCGTEPRGRTIYCDPCSLDRFGPSRRELCRSCKRIKVNVMATGLLDCWKCRYGK